LIQNGDFSVVGPDGNPVTSTSLFPGPCAAADWETFQNLPNTETYTEITSPPSGLPTGTATCLYFGAPTGFTNQDSEISQSFAAYGAGPKAVTISAWVYLMKGVVGIGVGHGGNTGYLTSTAVLNQWVYLTATHVDAGGNDEFIAGNSFFNSDHKVTDFYITDVSVTQSTPEPAPFAVMGFGAVALLRRRKKA
jgi:MYXO-CTERM domain-containing protein